MNIPNDQVRSFCLGTSLVLSRPDRARAAVWRAWASRRTCDPLGSRTGSLWNQKAHPPLTGDFLIVPKGRPAPGSACFSSRSGSRTPTRGRTENCWSGNRRSDTPMGQVRSGAHGKMTKQAGGNSHGRVWGRGQRRDEEHPCWLTQRPPGASASSCPPRLHLHPILSQGLTLVWACGL